MWTSEGREGVDPPKSHTLVLLSRTMFSCVHLCATEDVGHDTLRSALLNDVRQASRDRCRKSATDPREVTAGEEGERREEGGVSVCTHNRTFPIETDHV